MWLLYQLFSWSAPSFPSKNLAPAAACQLEAMQHVCFSHFYPINPWNVTAGSHQLALRSTLSHPLQGPRQPAVVQLLRLFKYHYANKQQVTTSSSSGNWCQLLVSQHRTVSATLKPPSWLLRFIAQCEVSNTAH